MSLLSSLFSFFPLSVSLGHLFPNHTLFFLYLSHLLSNLSIFSPGHCIHLGSSRDDKDFGYLHVDVVRDTDDLWECWRYTLAREEEYGGMACDHSPLSLLTTNLDTVGLETRSKVGIPLLSMHTHWVDIDYVSTLANWTKHGEPLFQKSDFFSHFC